MRKLILTLTAAALLAAGCSGAGEKGRNIGKDKPKPDDAGTRGPAPAAARA